MNKWQQMVREFHEKAGAAIANAPVKVVWPEILNLRIALIEEELGELHQAMRAHDAVEIADAIGDLLYVVLGTAVSCGIDIEPIFEEIHRSNMSKFIDGHRRADGKWIKGPSYSPANLTPIIEAQQNATSS